MAIQAAAKTLGFNTCADLNIVLVNPKRICDGIITRETLENTL